MTIRNDDTPVITSAQHAPVLAVVAEPIDEENSGDSNNGDDNDVVATIELTSDWQLFHVSAQSPLDVVSERRVVHAELVNSVRTLGHSERDEVDVDDPLGQQRLRQRHDLELGTVMNSVRESSELRTMMLTNGRNNRNNPRAEFVSACMIKPPPNVGLGFSFEKLESEDGITASNAEIISQISPGSVASTTPFQVGDIAVSIQGHLMDRRITSWQVAQWLHEASSPICMVVRNNPNIHNNAKSDWVESMITKQDGTRLVGLAIKQVLATTSGETKIVISQIVPNGLFEQSLLNVGDQILSVNGISCTQPGVTAAQIAQWMQAATDTVTVVAKTTRQTGVVLAEGSTRLSGGNALQQQIQQTNDQLASDPDVEQRKRRKIAFTLFAVLIFLAVLYASMRNSL